MKAFLNRKLVSCSKCHEHGERFYFLKGTVHFLKNLSSKDSLHPSE